MVSFNSQERAFIVGVLHPSFGQNLKWIDDFTPKDDRFIFEKVVPPKPIEVSWHNRGSLTTLTEWLHHFQYAFKAARSGSDVLVTNFPQLAFAVCFWKFLLRKRFRVVAWSFNIGSVTSKLKGRMAGLLLSNADLLIVHSRDEIGTYSSWLGLTEDNFLFVPFQHGTVKTQFFEENVDKPFLIALGSAGRDYRTLFAAVSGRPERVLVIAKPEAVEGLVVPPNVEVINGLSLIECQSLASRAVAGLVPVSNLDTASGQVTFLMLMALGVPLIVTDCPGSKDYIRDEHDGLIVAPSDPDALCRAIVRIWNDNELRLKLSKNGLRSWRERFSDEAAGVNLVRALALTVATPSPSSASES